MSQQWQRRPGESARAYAAARVYFEMGAGRSQAEVAQKSAKSRPLIKRWSSVWEWVSRAAAFDEYLESIANKALEQAAQTQALKWQERNEALRERMYNTAMRALDRVDRMFEFPLATVTTTGQLGPDGVQQNVTVVRPARWTFDTTARLALIGNRLAREAIKNEGSPSAADADRRDEVFIASDFV
jgi:hypothetical protein